MNKNLSVLISSCDKFSDLWDENVSLYHKYWKNNTCHTILVTDNETKWSARDIEVVVARGENDFPMRIRYALDFITTPYVLLTLDDYFLIDSVSNRKINYLVDRMQRENIQYLSLYNRRITKKRQYKSVTELFPIDMTRKYAITLYPAIWEVDFLKNAIKTDMSPWLFEPLLTKTAIKMGANCQASLAGVYNILDVVRKGKLLHKAKKYFKKNGISIGDRPVIYYRTEIKLFLMDVISWYMPRKMFKVVKTVARKCGMTFYSED